MEHSGDPAARKGENGDSREERIARIVADYSNRLNAGGHVDFRKVVEDCPELAPELQISLAAIGDVRWAAADCPEAGIVGCY